MAHRRRAIMLMRLSVILAANRIYSSDAASFTSTPTWRGVVVRLPSAQHHGGKQTTERPPSLSHDAARFIVKLPSSSSAMMSPRRPNNPLGMSRSDDGGPGIVTTIALAGILVIFLGSSVAPFLDSFNSDTSDSVTSQLANTAVTRQDPDALKQMQYQSKYDRLSRTKIQEKLSGMPAFYLVDGTTGEMSGEIYTSYADAKAASEASSSMVKATTLDQVMYPLVLKRGRTKMAPPPQEVKRAEEAIERHGSAGSKTYKLIPSAAAVEGAAGMKMELANGDVPLFIADRVAFASSSGPQVRLFEVTHLT
uniref:Uncharacterized protein n=1 Tax=Odontella aurita TaxID=265563 RepID=A0A7S4MIG8_9STRA|mmetsp:Transcript_22405/g.66420  ORF Transcript_22405/g.66420 Transcript_22405/m.66420 type:complete len:308 (+) Transcript_22405:42-965(+)